MISIELIKSRLIEINAKHNENFFHKYGKKRDEDNPHYCNKCGEQENLSFTLTGEIDEGCAMVDYYVPYQHIICNECGYHWEDIVYFSDDE